MSVQIRKSLFLCQAELLGLLVLQAVISWLVESWPWAGGAVGGEVESSLGLCLVSSLLLLPISGQWG